MIQSSRQLICRVRLNMSLNRPLSSLRLIATDSAVTIFVGYASGGFDVFSVALSDIRFDDSLSVKEFAKIIEQQQKIIEKVE